MVKVTVPPGLGGSPAGTCPRAAPRARFAASGSSGHCGWPCSARAVLIPALCFGRSRGAGGDYRSGKQRGQGKASDRCGMGENVSRETRPQEGLKRVKNGLPAGHRWGLRCFLACQPGGARSIACVSPSLGLRQASIARRIVGWGRQNPAEDRPAQPACATSVIRCPAYLGASTISIWRPSTRGKDSTLAISATSSCTRFKRSKPRC